MPELILAQSLNCDLDNWTTPYGVACLLFAGRLVRDRFNVLNKFSEFNWVNTVDPIYEPDNTPLSELMDRRANELLGNSITVQWSGGVDSTSLLLSLIKNGVSKEDLQIYYDSNSVEEYPRLLHWLQEQKYNTKEVRNWKKALGNVQTDIITNGWCADQLFGSMFFHQSAEKYHTPIEELLTSVIFPEGSLKPDEAAFATETFKKMGRDLFNIDLNIAAELGWFINYCLKWTWVSTFNELYLVTTPAYGKTRVFYDTPYFQAWSLNNFPLIKDFNIYGSNVKRYKRQLKEYCNSIFPDPDYLQNKTKKPSWNAALTSTRVNDRVVTLKSTKGYEIFNLPSQMPRGCPNLFDNAFFTKYKK